MASSANSKCSVNFKDPILIGFFIANILLIVPGLGLIIVGGLVLTDVTSINKDTVSILLDSFTVDSIQAVGRVQTLSIILIIIGVLLLLLVTLGIIGIFIQKRIIVIEYTNVAVILLIMEIIVLIMWLILKSKVEDKIQQRMLLVLEYNYKDDTTTSTANSLSNAWNNMFMELDCCGVNPVVSTTNDFDSTSWCTTSGTCQATASQIPKTCCLGVDSSTYTSAPSACHASVNPGTYNEKGCYDVYKDKLLYYSLRIIVLVSFALAFEIIAAILVHFIREKRQKSLFGRIEGM